MINMPERFWSKVDKTETCWLWTAARDEGGYGKFRLNGTMARAHRVAYALEVGPIPEGLQLDHLCKVPACVRPSHLEPVTGWENTRRSTNPFAARAAQTHCLRGHEFTPENIYLAPSSSTRECRICRKARRAHHYYTKERAS